MIKKLGIAFMLLSSVLLAIVLPTPAGSQTISLSKTYNWKLVSPMAAGQNTNIGIVEFAKQLEQRTGGKVKITLYESTLGAPADHWDMAKE